MAEYEPQAPERIEASFRYGSTIIIGVLAGFSLAFLTAWAANPLPWGYKDLFGLIPLLVGIILQIAAISQLLDHRSLELARYRRAVRWFMAGIILTGIGVAAAVAVDFVAVSNNFQAAKPAAGH
jgi:hypothetical protein